jgi:quercetin dioxygenase-like cupin family protein
MKAFHFVLRPDQHGRALNVVGTKVVVLASNVATQNYGVTLQQGDAGIGPLPHSHDWGECFYVLQGGEESLCDDHAPTCLEGTLVHVPRGTVHGFRFAAGGGRMLKLTGQGARAAEMFSAIDQEAQAGPPDVPRLVDVLRPNGVTVAT